jgi:phage tail-like protein
MPNGIGTVDPYRNFKFIVEINAPNGQFFSAGFMRVTGLTRTTDVIDYREGGENTTMHKLPGQTKFEQLTFERGATDNTDMYNWAKQTDNFDGAGVAGLTSFNPARATLTISVLDGDNNVLEAYEVQRAWVSEFNAGEFDSKGNDVLIERMVVQHEGYRQIGTRQPSNSVVR